MFELSVALKYLLPRWRQLSVSIIAMISTLVIALVVWLILVFFSVTDGLEKSWVDRLVALTAPVRVSPTNAYYHSYYHQVDGISFASDYASKSLHEKLLADAADPYDPETDMEIPRYWPLPDRNDHGEVRDIVKTTVKAIETLGSRFPGLVVADYEITFGNIRIRQVRREGHDYSGHYEDYQNFLNQASYLSSFEPTNPKLEAAIVPFSPEDLTNALHLCSYGTDNVQENHPSHNELVDQAVLKQRLEAFFTGVDISHLKTRDKGWRIPHEALPIRGDLKVIALMDGRHLNRLVVPCASRDISKHLAREGHQLEEGVLTFTEGGPSLKLNSGAILSVNGRTPIILEGGQLIPAKVDKASFDTAQAVEDVLFDVDAPIQNTRLTAKLAYGDLSIGKAMVKEEADTSPLWLHRKDGTLSLPFDDDIGEGVLLARGFRDSGIRLGDRGYLSYYSPTASSVQEQRLPIFVAGFYDPGIIPLGGKFIVANRDVTAMVRAAYDTQDDGLGNGLNVWVPNNREAPEVKQELEKVLRQANLAHYWKVETYRDYDFTRDIIQQLQSEKNLFSLISLIIIVVACSNIISMLIILVNDKKMEIGILRSMGASSKSIALIFGTCGVVMGLIGSVIGTLVAMFTLRNLQGLIDFLSALQGYDAFNRVLYGESLPNQLSFEALLFVLCATAGISLLAGLVPAVKASMMRPSAILRSE